MDIKELLNFAVINKASDLHLSAGLVPMVRIDGVLNKINNAPTLDSENIKTMLKSIVPETIVKELEENLEVDFALDLGETSRFRVNAFKQNRGLACAFRTIPTNIPSFQELGLPDVIKEISLAPRGLVLVTGPTGSGKSTTLASMIDLLNTNGNDHIITIEDPIEFVHKSKKCLINQREVYRDTKSFNIALRSALREDPDTILIGEMRDLESIRLAITAAETGHLVFGTLHTTSAAKTVNRIIDVFPGGEQPMIRSMLSDSLHAVISQELIPRINKGRIATLEIMICSYAIRNLIRENKIAQIYSSIQTSNKVGMQTLDQHLTKLVTSKIISVETAQNVAIDKNLFK